MARRGTTEAEVTQEETVATEAEVTQEETVQPVAIEAPSIPSAPVQTNVLIANQHSGPIILPRSTVQGQQRVQLAPTILHPGTVTLVDGEVWEEHKRLPVIAHYLDKRLLAEVTFSGGVPVMDITSTNLDDCIPEHLQTEEESGQTGATARVTKTDVGNIKI